MLHPGLLEGGGTSLKRGTEASSSHDPFRCPPPPSGMLSLGSSNKGSHSHFLRMLPSDPEGPQDPKGRHPQDAECTS